MALRLTAGNMNHYKFIVKLWVKHCAEKTEIFDVVQEKLNAKVPEGRSKLLVKVCKILTKTYCDSGKEGNDILEDRRLVIIGYPPDLHIPLFSDGGTRWRSCLRH
jgi:hypothetical protein